MPHWPVLVLRLISEGTFWGPQYELGLAVDQYWPIAWV